MRKGISQLNPIQANEYLTQARDFDSVEITRNAEQIGASIATQVAHSRSFLPALGQYLYFRGRPFPEGMAKMMQPAFKMDLSPMSVWKCGRQVGKSLTLAAKSIMLTAVLPYFSTLTVTPQFEMTRRFSTNYVNPLINESPVRAELTGIGYSNNVLQKTFKNNSMMHFSFAFLDCNRIRGLAIDRMHIDECSVKFSSIQTVDGERLIGYNLKKGNKLLAFNEQECIVTDTVMDVVCKGLRPSWKITLVDGRTLTCTANERLRTDRGWVYLQEILDYAYERRTGNKVEPRQWVTQGGSPWHDARGRLDAVDAEEGPQLVGAAVHDTRSLSGGILPPQGSPIEGLCQRTTKDSTQRGLGARKLYFQHAELPSIRLLVASVLPDRRQDEETQEGGYQGAGSSADSYELGVHVHGRRQPQQVTDISNDLHPQLQPKGCTTTDKPSCSARHPRPDETRQPYEEGQKGRLVHHNERRGDERIHNDDQAIPPRKHGVQGRDNHEAGRAGELPVLRESRADGSSSRRTHGGLRLGRMPEAAPQDPERQVQGSTREAGRDQREGQGTLLRQPGRESAKEEREYAAVYGGSEVSCTTEQTEERTSSQEKDSQPDTYRDGILQLLRGPYPAENPEERCTDSGLLEDWLQEGEAQASLNSLSPAEEDSHLTPVEILSIEYVGETEVWDVETENHHTLLVNGVAVHNCQDIDPDFIPIIAQTMGRSRYRLQDFSGTPKTFDNTMEILWKQSSRAEWLIPCSCGHWNDPNIEADALKMIGIEGLVCAKCSRPLDANSGHWHHMNTDGNKRVEFPGYHVPQFILPFHYEDKRNWKIILDAVKGNVAPYILYNEIMAESYDTGSKLVTETDLKSACKIPANLKDYEDAKSRTRHYIFTVLGIDWGGRGATGISMTKAAVMGMRPDGHMELIYGENMSTLIDEAAEVIRAIQIFNDFSCHMLAHDAGGSGGMRDVLLSNSRFPMQKVMPFVYVRAWANNPITFHPGTEIQPKAYYSLDKARSLALMSNMIKSDWMLFPRWETCHELISDFLALVEEKNETKRAGDLYLITRAENSSDDFAHAVNFACMCAFHKQDKYPDLLQRVDQARFELNEQQVSALAPNPTQADWEMADLDEDGYEVL